MLLTSTTEEFKRDTAPWGNAVSMATLLLCSSLIASIHTLPLPPNGGKYTSSLETTCRSVQTFPQRSKRSSELNTPQTKPELCNLVVASCSFQQANTQHNYHIFCAKLTTMTSKLVIF